MENKEQQLKENGLRLRITVKDSEGNILNQVEKKSDSMVKNYGLFLRTHAGTSNTLIDSTGVSRTIQIGSQRVWCSAGSRTWSYFHLEEGVGGSAGIRIGTGTTPVTKDDYDLATILTSTEFDQFSNEMTYSIDSLSGIFKIVRSFRNISGVDQSVNETGIYATFNDPVQGNYLFLIARDLTGSQIIPNNDMIEILYSFNYYW